MERVTSERPPLLSFKDRQTFAKVSQVFRNCLTINLHRNWSDRALAIYLSDHTIAFLLV